MDTITAIKKALEGVTPGPWVTYEGSLGYKGDVYAPTAKSVKDCHHIARCFAPKPAQHPLCDLQAIKVVDDAVAAVEANTIYIAAVNPVVISKLLSTLESLQRENEDLRKKADNRESELVAMLNSADESRVAQIRRAEAAEADLREHQSSYILVHGIFTTEIQRLKNNLTALCEAYAACNGEDHPAYITARAALSSTGDTHGN